MQNRFYPYKVFMSLCLTITYLSGNPAPDDFNSIEVDLPFEKFVLDNGLTLIVHEDHKAPIVAVNVWYHVGSKNEKPGRTGFAHLFEHLMFNGSEHYNDDYFKPLQEAGATGMNGTTNRDRTNYFQVVPRNALDLALWMESDRMGHLLGAIDQARLDEQRGVVQNEKRQGENQPYGRVWELISKNTFPAGHPYSWTTIGSMEDLNAASVDDVHEWFQTYYGAANAVLVVAGDVNTAEVKNKVEKYFGSIASGPPVQKQELWIPPSKATSHRQIMQDRVPSARIYKVWNVPEWGSEDSDHLELAAEILGNGKNSRLYRRLVYQDQIATEVAVYNYAGEIAGQIIVEATARPEVDLSKIEKALDEEIQRFLEEGPTESELERVQTKVVARFIRGAERIGGFYGKSDILAMSEVYGGRPDYYKVSLERARKASTRQIRNAAGKWLKGGAYILEVHPFPEYKTLSADVDRSRLPVPEGDPPQPDFPELRRAKLSNGLQIVLAERHSVPLINFSLIVNAGYAADGSNRPGTAALTLSMLDEGTESRTALEISEELALLGAELRTSSNVDTSTVSLSTLKSSLDESLAIYSDVILEPTFPEREFQRVQQEQLARIKQEKQRPVQMAMRVLPALLFGKDHPYGNPATGSGTFESVASMTRQDLENFHETWFQPNNATLVVVGDTSIEEIKPKLEQLFSNWSPADVPQIQISRVEPPAQAVVYLMDRPDSVQSLILAATLIPGANTSEEIAIGAMNDILGGTFTSRMNMKLREEKGWSYGSRTVISDARAQRPFFVYAPVQTDKTGESIAEIKAELRKIVSDAPPSPQELEKTKKDRTLSLPGSWETIGSVAASIADIVQFGYSDDYYQNYPGRVMALELQQVSRAARDLIDPERMVWVVVGDRAKIESEIRALNLGEVRVLQE